MNRTRVGLSYGFGAYLIWGSFPFYFGLIAAVGPFEVIAWRIPATLACCAIFVTALRGWGRVAVVLRSPRQLAALMVCALLIYANWQIFVLGVMTNHVLETSLGYFINPVFTVFLRVVVRREHLTRLQWVAVGIAAVGVTISAFAYGAFPWIALGIAVTFGVYGAIHKQVGASVDGVTGLTVETAVTLPVAAIQLVVVANVAGITAFSFGAGVATLVFFAGAMTALPLIFFGESVRRLPLTYLGFLQFLTPILGFLYGYFVAHEEITVGRWIGFVGVWVAVVVLVADMVLRSRRLPRPLRSLA